MTIQRGACLESIELVYRRQFHRFLHVASAITCDPDSAADAVQEALASAVRHRHGFRGDGPPEAWLWRLVVNAARRHVRQGAGVDHSMDESGLDYRDQRTVAAHHRSRWTSACRRSPCAHGSVARAAAAGALSSLISPGSVWATLNVAHASLRLRVDEEVAL
jgi:DNA-directed RNA polymerase specialized sigma24 family protein